MTTVLSLIFSSDGFVFNKQDSEQIESIYTQEEELCPYHLLHQHEEWLRKHSKNVVCVMGINDNSVRNTLV